MKALTNSKPKKERTVTDQRRLILFILGKSFAVQKVADTCFATHSQVQQPTKATYPGPHVTVQMHDASRAQGVTFLTTIVCTVQRFPISKAGTAREM
jgi:hypothetical protein